MVDVPETVLVTLVFLVVVKPRDGTIRMHVVVLAGLAILLPVAPVFADRAEDPWDDCELGAFRFWPLPVLLGAWWLVVLPFLCLDDVGGVGW